MGKMSIDTQTRLNCSYCEDEPCQAGTLRPSEMETEHLAQPGALQALRERTDIHPSELLETASRLAQHWHGCNEWPTMRLAIAQAIRMLAEAEDRKQLPDYLTHPLIRSWIHQGHQAWDAYHYAHRGGCEDGAPIAEALVQAYAWAGGSEESVRWTSLHPATFRTDLDSYHREIVEAGARRGVPLAIAALSVPCADQSRRRREVMLASRKWEKLNQEQAAAAGRALLNGPALGT